MERYDAVLTVMDWILEKRWHLVSEVMEENYEIAASVIERLESDFGLGS